MRARDDVIAAAGDMLVHRRSADGLWSDFRTLAGESRDWVTAFVVFAGQRCEALREAAHGAIRSLYYRQRPSGGWGYNETVPPDCDTSAWVLLAMSTSTLWRPSAVGRAVGYIRRHWHRQTRAFCTYTREDGIDRYIEAPQELTGGWTSPHPCVTAVALQSLITIGAGRGDAMVCDGVMALREQQDSDGLWSSYWWRGHAYGTHHALRALVMAEALTSEVWRRARDGVIARMNDDGGWGDAPGEASHTFATAMTTLTLLLREDSIARKYARRGVDFIVRAAHSHGWASSPILRIPSPADRVPEETMGPADELGTNTLVTDQHASFTTAAALWALCVARDMHL